MLRKVQTLLAVCDPRPEPISPLLEIVLQTTNAPDFPPHFLTWWRKPLGIICPERLQSRLADRLDSFDKVLARRSSSLRKFSLLVFAQNGLEDLASLIGNVQPDNATIAYVKSGRTGPDPVLLSFDNLDARTAL